MPLASRHCKQRRARDEMIEQDRDHLRLERRPVGPRRGGDRNEIAPEEHPVTSPRSNSAAASGEAAAASSSTKFAGAGCHHLLARQELERGRVGRGFGFDEHGPVACRDWARIKGSADSGAHLHWPLGNPCSLALHAGAIDRHVHSAPPAVPLLASLRCSPRRRSAPPMARPAPRCAQALARATCAVALSRAATSRATRNGCSANCPTACAMPCARTGCRRGRSRSGSGWMSARSMSRTTSAALPTCSNIWCSASRNISPRAQAIPTWQRLGATFGSDTNAETGPVSTTYKLDLPNATPGFAR